MRRTHYEVLGVKPDAKPEDVKRAYRALVLKHHPDRSKATGAAERFIEIAEAYETLSDPARRQDYDRTLEAIRTMRAKSKEPARPAPPASPPASAPKRPPATNLDLDLRRLVQLMSNGNLKEAEPLARRIAEADPRQPVPYAVLGDIHRARGEWKLASKMYAFAAQFDPRNVVYLRKHEEAMDMIERRVDDSMFPKGREGRAMAPAVGGGLCLVAACYVAMSPEASIFSAGTIISTWTVGLMSMLLFCGAVMGATLSLADYVDRFEVANTFGRLSPSLVFMALAMANLWVAAGLYLLTGAIMRSFSISISRMLIALVAVVTLMTIGAAASHTIDPYQVMLWGGSIASFGAVMGWAFADGLRG